MDVINPGIQGPLTSWEHRGRVAQGSPEDNKAFVQGPGAICPQDNALGVWHPGDLCSLRCLSGRGSCRVPRGPGSPSVGLCVPSLWPYPIGPISRCLPGPHGHPVPKITCENMVRKQWCEIMRKKRVWSSCHFCSSYNLFNYKFK